MTLTRREFAAGAAAMAAAGCAVKEEKAMYGLIGKFTAVEGRRDDLIAILLADVAGLPGCRSYVVAKDPADPDAIWITEVWDDRESHAASLQLPAVKAAIARGRPLIAGMEAVAQTEPVGGRGLS